jgi:cytochrome c oxidase subunit II
VTIIPPALRPNRQFPTSRRRLALALAAVTVVSLAAAGPAFANFWTPESGGSPNADRIHSLYVIVLVVAGVVFFGVEGALLYALFKFRARKGAVAAQIRGNTRLEIGWTIGAAVILVVLATVTFIKLPGIRNPDNSGPDGLQTAGTPILTAQVDSRQPPNGKSLRIAVNGQQYIGRYTYPDGDANTLTNPFSYTEMVVPTDTTVTLDIRAQDVAHSWWVPKLGGKFDAVPGYTNHTWFKIPAKFAGATFAKGTVFTGQCAELCGRNHANMIARVRAVTPAQFEQWIAQRKADVAQADDTAAAGRKKLDAQLNGQ